MARTMADAFYDYHTLAVKPLAENLSTISGGSGGDFDTSTLVSRADFDVLSARIDSVIQMASNMDDFWITYDASSNHEMTKYGSPALVAEHAKFGKGLQITSGNGITSDAITLGGQDFTIDFWAYIPAIVVDYQRLFHLYDVATNGSGDVIVFYTASATDIGFQSFGESPLNQAFLNVGTLVGERHHFAVCYSHSSQYLKIYLDGQNVGTLNDFTKTRIARYLQFSNPGNSCHANEIIDELRISDGICRWAADFTPPTQEYLVDEYTELLMHFNI